MWCSVANCWLTDMTQSTIIHFECDCGIFMIIILFRIRLLEKININEPWSFSAGTQSISFDIEFPRRLWLLVCISWVTGLWIFSENTLRRTANFLELWSQFYDKSQHEIKIKYSYIGLHVVQWNSIYKWRDNLWDSLCLLFKHFYGMTCM